MRKRAAAPAVLTLVLLALLSEPAFARVPGRTPRRQLESEVSEQLDSPQARGTVAGILVQRGGAQFLSLNADRPFIPASLAKLATTTAALSTFGPDYRFQTSVVISGEPKAGIVTGPLTLVGGGDPTFVSAAYGRKRYLPAPNDPSPIKIFPHGFPTVENLATQIARTGLKQVHGDLVMDESLFDTARTQPGWLAKYQKPGSVEVGNLSALTVDEGLNDITGINVSPDPAVHAGTMLKAALAARGVIVTGTIHSGVAPKGAKQIARILSPPLSEIVFYTNRFSVNYCAEMMLKGMGAKFGGAGTTKAGLKVVADTLRNAGIPLDGFSFTDGSGLSTDDRVTPRTIAALLQHALEDQTPVAQAMRDSIPVAGGPGTLFKRLRIAPAVGNLRGKTGFLGHVRAMAGWVRGLDGSMIVYVTMFNDATSPRALTGPIDMIGLDLAKFPYG